MKLLLILGLLITSQANAEITWSNNIKNLLKNNCVICHQSTSMKDFREYDQAFKYRKKIMDRVVIKKDMPASITTLTDDERKQVKEWIDSGAKE